MAPERQTARERRTTLPLRPAVMRLVSKLNIQINVCIDKKFLFFY